MKKLVPFKKDIILNNLYEVTSISLEHNLTHNDTKVEGEFIVSGEYRVTETSINTEKFNYNLPFQIEIDDKYDISSLEIDIDDFYYEIIDNKILSINIDVLLNKLVEKEVEVIELREEKEDIIEDNIEEEEKIMENNCIEKEDINPIKEQRDNNEIKSIFNNLEEEESFVSYKVYIVRENDTIEKIIEKYNIKKEELEIYNDLSLLKIGDKVIIPHVKN